MLVMLVKNNDIEIGSEDILFYKTTGSTEEAVVLPNGFIGTLESLMEIVLLELGYEFKGIFDKEFMSVVLPLGVDSINFSDLWFGKALGFKGSSLTAFSWGLSRFMIENDLHLGNEGELFRPYEIESGFTLSGQVYKDTPGVSTVFYSMTFADYTFEQTKTGVIPFAENLESNIDMKLGVEAYNYYKEYFTSNVFQINFKKPYLERGDVLNGHKVLCEMSERPSLINEGKVEYYIVLSTGQYVSTNGENYVIVER